MTRKEYNRQYYLRNRDRLRERAKKRKRSRIGKADLKLVSNVETLSAKVETIMEESAETASPRMLKPQSNVETFRLKPTRNGVETIRIIEQMLKPSQVLMLKPQRNIETSFALDLLKPTVETFNYEAAPDVETAETKESAMEAKVIDIETKEDVETPRKERNVNLTWTEGFKRLFGSPSNVLRLLFMIGMTTLFYFLQVEFYEKHDSVPELAWGLALACELSLLCLLLTKFDSWWKNFLKGVVYVALFGYLIASLGFHQYQDSRLKLVEENQVEETVGRKAELQEQLRVAQLALESATKGRSWDNMQLFGEQVEKLQLEIVGISKTKSLGVTDSNMTLASALLIILFRILLIAVNSINTLKLRENIVQKAFFWRSFRS